MRLCISSVRKCSVAWGVEGGSRQGLSIVPKTAYHHSRAGGNPGGWRSTSFLCEPTLERPCPLASPLDKNMGALVYLHMSSWIDSTLNRRQTVASAKKGSDRASGSSPKRSRRGQVGQKQGRSKIIAAPTFPKLGQLWTGQVRAAGAGF